MIEIYIGKDLEKSGKTLHRFKRYFVLNSFQTLFRLAISLGTHFK